MTTPIGHRTSSGTTARYVATIPLSRNEYDTYYLGYSNRVLWPSFHYRLGLLDYESSFIEGYRRVNAMIADHLAKMILPNDLVWIHDYHLIPLASELRSRGVKARIGFFLHIPFPPPDVLVAVPDHAWLIETMFAYDVLGFQTSSDVTNFQRFVLEQAGGVLKLRAGRCPRSAAPSSSAVSRSGSMSTPLKTWRTRRKPMPASGCLPRELFLSRADHRRRPARLYQRPARPVPTPFRRLLRGLPRISKRVILMQIAPPTREEVAGLSWISAKSLKALSGNINGDFGDFDWTPVRYIHRSIARDILAALFPGQQSRPGDAVA